MRYHQKRLRENQGHPAMLAEMKQKLHLPEVQRQARDMHLADVHASTGEQQVEAALSLRTSVAFDLRYLERVRRAA